MIQWHPKFIPYNVSIPPPVNGVLKKADDATGASNEKTTRLVPTIKLTVICPLPIKLVMAPTLQAMVVSELHSVVAHDAPPSRELVERSTDPKFNPVTVTMAPPLGGEFRTITDSIAPATAQGNKMVVS